MFPGIAVFQNRCFKVNEVARNSGRLPNFVRYVDSHLQRADCVRRIRNSIVLRFFRTPLVNQLVQDSNIVVIGFEFNDEVRVYKFSRETAMITVGTGYPTYQELAGLPIHQKQHCLLFRLSSLDAHCVGHCGSVAVQLAKRT